MQTIQTTLESQKQQALQDIEHCFQDLASAQDVSPARKFRLEGRLQVLLAVGVIDILEIQQYCCAQQQAYHLPESETEYWAWATSQAGTIRLPFYMQPAPVYPSK